MKEYEEQVEIMKALKDKVDAVEGKKWEDGVGYVQLKHLILTQNVTSTSALPKAGYA